MTNERTVLFVGAHSGGHLYPAISIARALEKLGVRSVFAGVGREIERDILGAEGFPLHTVRDLRSPGAIPGAWSSVGRLFAELDPAAVVGTGGAAALCPGIRAALSRRPLFLLEPNRILGRANRWLLRAATRIFLSFSDTRGPRTLRRRSLNYGCPVRPEFEPSALPEHGPVLVLGGSQGSSDLNALVVEAVAHLDRSHVRLTVRHVAGPGHAAELGRRYQELGVEAEVVEYEADVADAIARSVLVVARSGGSTVSEVSAVGRGALYLPYPHHKDRQQFLNAEAPAVSGAAHVISRDPAALSRMLSDVLADRDRLERMADASIRRGRPSAARDIARVIATHIEALPTGAGKVA